MMKGRRKANLEPAWIFPRELLSAYFESCIKFGGVINGALSRNVGTMRVDNALQQTEAHVIVGQSANSAPKTLSSLMFSTCHSVVRLVTTNLRITKEFHPYKLPFSEANFVEDTLRCVNLPLEVT